MVDLSAIFAILGTGKSGGRGANLRGARKEGGFEYSAEGGEEESIDEKTTLALIVYYLQ